MNTTTTPTGWEWQPDTAPAAGRTRVDLGRGAHLWVDLTVPEHPVAAHASDPGALARLSAALGVGYCEDLLRTHPTGGTTGDSRRLPELPPLTPAWAHLALVKAVNQYSPLHLDESLLVIDQALAWQQVGFPRRAAALAQAVDTIIVDLWAAGHAGILPVTAASLAAQAVNLLAEAPDTDPDTLARIAALQATNGPELSDVDLVFLTELWASEIPLASHLGATKPPELPALLLDPRMLPPRLLRWGGTNWTDITLSPSSLGLTLHVALRQGCEPWSVEARTLRAIAIDTTNGDRLATATFTASGSDGDEDRRATLIAHLDLSSDRWHNTTIIVVALEPSTSIDASPTSQIRAQMERLLLAGWSTARVARATDRTELTPQPEQYLITARHLIATLPAGTDFTSTEGAALEATIRRVQNPHLWQQAHPDPLISAPLLAEILYGLDLGDLRNQITDTTSLVLGEESLHSGSTPERPTGTVEDTEYPPEAWTTAMWHLASQSDFALSASTEPAADPRVDDNGLGVRIVRQPLSNGTAYIGLEVRDAGASAGELLRLAVGSAEEPTSLFFVLVPAAVLRGPGADEDVLASEVVIPSSYPWPELWVAYLPAIDPRTLTHDDLNAVTLSVAGASLPCKDAWRRLALAAPVDDPLREAVRAGLSQHS
jgi:hypothetical protein